MQPSENSTGDQGRVFTLPILNTFEIQQFIDAVYSPTIKGMLNVVHSGDFTGRQFHRKDINSLISYVKSLDVHGTPGIYLRATTNRLGLTAGKRGGAHDTVELPGLWADLDFGTAGHADRSELPRPPDEASAASIVALAGLPTPSLWVHSGGGVYPWWLLHEPFTATPETQNYLTTLSRKWQAILSAAAKTKGWFYGTEASDLARVLRLPGTVNRKVGDRLRPCYLVAQHGPRYLLQELHQAAETAAQRWSVNVSPALLGVRADNQDTAMFVAGLKDAEGVPCWRMAGLRDRWIAAIQAAGPSCHDEGLKASTAIAEEAAKGHHGALTVMEAVRAAWLGIRQPGATTGRAIESADEEWSRLEQGAWSKAAARASTPGDSFFKDQDRCRCFDIRPLSESSVSSTVDNDFWSSRPSLKHVHDFALSRRASPWATLGVTLARVSATAPPKVVLPPLIGGVVSINIFLALVGGSGRGKGAAMRAAKDAIILCSRGVLDEPEGEHYFDEHKLGTGQAIAHAYAYRDKDGVHRSADSALFMLDEVDHLSGHASQVGSTILAELKCLYMGEKLGSFYVDPVKRIEIKEQTYRAGFIVGVQPEKSQVLFNDTEGGTPQRFVWLPTTYAQPRQKPSGPEPLRWVPPDWSGQTFSPAGDLLPWSAQAQIRPQSEHIILPVAASACEAIDQANWEQSTGQGDPLDGHRLLCQEKVAAAFGILAGHVEITEEDWQLADHLMALSDRTRGGVLDVLASEAAKRNTARGKAEASRAVMVDDAKEDAAVKRVARGVCRLLEAHGGWMAHGELRRKIKNTDRARCDEALVYLMKTSAVESEKINYQGQDGLQYRRGKI